MPAAQQAGPELYAGNNLDRGHLARRRDPVWGTAAIAERANTDIFHYSVCAPQTATLNQSKTLWLGLEDYVLEHAWQYGQRLSVFSGYIFAAENPVYGGRGDPTPDLQNRSLGARLRPRCQRDTSSIRHPRWARSSNEQHCSLTYLT